MSKHRFYINPDDVKKSFAAITGQDAKHLVNVLRLKRGDKVELADGQGSLYLSEIESASSKQVMLKIIEKKFLDAESPAHITIAQAMLKDKKMDTILRHLTELGIKEWIPFFAMRSVPCPDFSHKKQSGFDFEIPKSDIGRKSKDARVERWERIARESIKQCGRSLVPVIHNPISFKEMINEISDYDQKIVFWEDSETPFDQIRNRLNISKNDNMGQDQNNCVKIPAQNGTLNKVEHNKIVVMIGPEGGFSEQEIESAMQNGFESFSLGNRILRADTASIAACALVQNIFGDLGKKQNDIEITDS